MFVGPLCVSRGAPARGWVPRGWWTSERVWPASRSCVAFLSRPRKSQTPEPPWLIKSDEGCLLGSQVYCPQDVTELSDSSQQEKHSPHEGGPAWPCHLAQRRGRQAVGLVGVCGPSCIRAADGVWTFSSVWWIPALLSCSRESLSGCFHGFTSGCKAHFFVQHDEYAENGAL